MSSIYIDADLFSPQFGHAWRDHDQVYAVVRLGDAYLRFDSAADARAAARACEQAADAHDKLTADTRSVKEEKPHGQPAA